MFRNRLYPTVEERERLAKFEEEMQHVAEGQAAERRLADSAYHTMTTQGQPAFGVPEMDFENYTGQAGAIVRLIQQAHGILNQLDGSPEQGQAVNPRDTPPGNTLHGSLGEAQQEMKHLLERLESMHRIIGRL